MMSFLCLKQINNFNSTEYKDWNTSERKRIAKMALKVVRNYTPTLQQTSKTLTVTLTAATFYLPEH